MINNLFQKYGALLVAVLVVTTLVLGYVAGSWKAGLSPVDRTAQKALSLFSSPLVQEWRGNATGVLISVGEQSIEIGENAKSLTISISSGTVIQKIVLKEDGTQETVDGAQLTDLKTGDRITVIILRTQEGELRTEQVIAIEAPKSPPAPPSS
ncbi:MAG: hypothetical protein Q7R48_01490 [bacterium]|nr:hypothetical protein [bacterium]